MGYLRNVFGLGEAVFEVTAAPAAFEAAEDIVGGADIDPAVFGLSGWQATISPAARIDRRSAIQVPAVKRSRDLIAGTLGGLPLDCYATDRTTVDAPLFKQPEKNIPRSVTMTRLFEDLLFEGIAWWRIVETGKHDYPTYVKRLTPASVTVDEDKGVVYVNGKAVSDDELIRFDSPTDGLLKAGARAIRTCLALDIAAADASDGAPPIQYFRPADGDDPADDDEIVEILEDWKAARRTRTTGYVPASLVLEDGGWDPQKLQLVEQRQHAVLEIARVAGIDPEELGVSTTSRTYSNQFDRRKAFVDLTLGIYMHAVEDRLSMGDVTTRGQYAKFNLDVFLRSDPAARYAAYAAGLQVGAIDQAEIRDLEDKPQLATAPARPALVGLPSRTEESA